MDRDDVRMSEDNSPGCDNRAGPIIHRIRIQMLRIQTVPDAPALTYGVGTLIQVPACAATIGAVGIAIADGAVRPSGECDSWENIASVQACKGSFQFPEVLAEPREVDLKVPHRC